STNSVDWQSVAGGFTAWTVADDDGDTYSVVDSNVLRFTSTDGNVLTNLTNGDDGDENLDLQIRQLGDAVAGSGLTGGADDVLVGADGDTTFNIGDGTGILVNADDIGFDCSEVEGNDIDCSGEAITLETVLDFVTTINLAGTSGSITGATATIDFTDFDVSADGAITIANDSDNPALTVTPSGATTTAIDVSNSNITNAIAVGANAILGTSATIDFTNFDVDDHGGIAISPASALTTGIDLTDTDITNALDIDANFLLFDGIQVGELTTGTLTVEDTSGNDLITITDAGTTGNLNVTGALTLGTALAVAEGGTGATSLNDLITLGTHTTGNYVATIADAGSSTITVNNSGSETAAVTLDVVDVNCTDCLNATEIADIYLLNTGDAGTGVFDFGGATSLEIVNGTAVTTDAAGELALDTNGDGSNVTTGVLQTYDGTNTLYLFGTTAYP
ncbi:MAG: hypothetical protein R3330_14690, partial [Saprospiraceae bacterium]|nr:hypothetical protein [Saprospiraceae bacterium]